MYFARIGSPGSEARLRVVAGLGSDVNRHGAQLIAKDSRPC